jgi:pectate disaccharide-lyase
MKNQPFLILSKSFQPIHFVLALILALVPGLASAKTFFLAPMGDDANPGTSDLPFTNLTKAVAGIGAGDTLLFKTGTYHYTTTVTLDKSGRSDARIFLLAAPGAKPILDFSAQPYASTNRAILLTGDYWTIRGLEITQAGDNGIKLEGSHNKIEMCVLHHNGDTGIQLGFAHETKNPDGTMCSYNEIINCDSYYNFDFDNAGGDADGFACKMHNGKGNVFRGCRSWHNADDGWDLYETDWPVEITDCWTWHNGDKTDFDAIYQAKMGKAMSSYQGNGNGFKLGGNGTGGNSVGTHVVKRCIAFDNSFRSKKGFDQNSHTGGVSVQNCVAFGNGYNYMFEDNPTSGNTNEFKNNVAFGVKGSLDHEFSSAAVLKNNSWDLTVTATGEDFQSITEEMAKAGRRNDGALPDNAFCKLVPGSDLIDQGIDVGGPFTGKAPDLGAFEVGGTSTISRTRIAFQFHKAQKLSVLGRHFQKP